MISKHVTFVQKVIIKMKPITITAVDTLIKNRTTELTVEEIHALLSTPEDITSDEIFYDDKGKTYWFGDLRGKPVEFDDQIYILIPKISNSFSVT